MGRRALTKTVGLAVLALLALYALLGGDLGDLGLDGDSPRESQPTTSTAAEAPQEPQAPPEPREPQEPQPESGGQAPDGFSQEEADGIADTLAAIEAGDLPYDQDGTTFQNREGLLPDREAGYYREFTVITPGSDDRGARRLVIGAGGDTWYTRDHYDSFVQIDPADFP